MFDTAKTLNTTCDGANQPTAASVERSFSMLFKPITKDQNFPPENRTDYMCVHYNLSTNCANWIFF